MGFIMPGSEPRVTLISLSHFSNAFVSGRGMFSVFHNRSVKMLTQVGDKRVAEVDTAEYPSWFYMSEGQLQDLCPCLTKINML